MKRILISLLQFYKKGLSPFLGDHCRYFPSCSDYACQAIEKWGAGIGLFIGLKRLLRCHPLGGKGFDPVPVISSSKRALKKDFL